MEIFKDIKGYEGLYQVSNMGNVKSLNKRKGRILKPQKDSDGYLQVNLYKQGKLKHHKIHRLVAQAFIDNPNNYEEVNHRDEDKTNNNVTNLEWCTRLYNHNYGTINQRIAESNINHPKTSKQVLCVETGLIYPSTMEVQRQFGFRNVHISSACNGKLKKAYGYTWRYV